MRWDGLFRDLEGQLEAAQRLELAAEVSDRTRREAARVRLGDRLRAACGHSLTLHVRGAGQVTGVLRDLAEEWLLLTERAAEEMLVPSAALLGIVGLGTRSDLGKPAGTVGARLGLGHALRAIARDRRSVTLVLVDGGVLAGTLDRVGADFCELAEHGPGEERRRQDVRWVRAVPFAAIGVVRSS